MERRKKEEFCTILNSAESELRLNDIYNKLENASSVNESLIDENVEALGDIFKTAGKSHTKMRTCDGETGGIKTNGRWYDKICKDKKAIFEALKQNYAMTRSDTDRIIMCQARNDYRKVCRQKRKAFHVQKANELSTLSKSNQKKFWNFFKVKKDPTGNCNFRSYFKNLYENKSNPGVLLEEIIYDPDNDNIIFDIEFLNKEIISDELENALIKLKNNKSCGLDNILNEFLKASTPLVKNVMLKLFNVILNSGIFPKEWARGEIIPIFKKGEINDPQNYRGVTLVSCLGKLFTYILNERLTSWAEENSVFLENQFGFRKSKSTVDCSFILHGLVQHFLNSSTNLYCSFVDLSRAFDNVDRNVLWFKLQQAGISCKIINLVKNM